MTDKSSNDTTRPQRARRLPKLFAAPILALLAACAMLPGMAQTPAAPTAATITFFEDAAATVEGKGATANGSHVLVTEAGTYTVTGLNRNGSITVSAPGQNVTLVLSGLDLINPVGPAIYVEAAGLATVTLATGTHNVLVDNGNSDLDAALYANSDLVIDGEGSLDVFATYEGISSTSHITILGGVIRIFAHEDGINANQDWISHIQISGGTIYIQTETGDGIDSNGTLTIDGGLVITQAALVDANSGLVADGAVTLGGGAIIATGSPMMGAIDAGSAQESIVVNYNTVQAASTLIVVRDDAGNDLLVFAPANDYRQLIFSSPDLRAGVTYTVHAGGTPEGEGVDGLYEAAANPGSVVAEVTTDSSSSTGGSFGQRGPGTPGAPGMPGGPGGQRR